MPIYRSIGDTKSYVLECALCPVLAIAPSILVGAKLSDSMEALTQDVGMVVVACKLVFKGVGQIGVTSSHLVTMANAPMCSSFYLLLSILCCPTSLKIMQKTPVTHLL